MINIFFDLDGPIIDVSERYYRAYLESLKGVSSNSPNILEKNEFWELKRNRITDFEISLMSGLSANDARTSADIRRELSFKSELLSLDKLFSDVYEVFESLKANRITFCIVTLRRKKQLLYAIKQFKLDKFIKSEFTFGLEDSHKITNDIQEKHILLIQALNKLETAPQEAWLIGDTDTDIFAGRLAKVSKIIGITRGIRSKEQLEILKPDYIVENLTEIISLISRPLSSISNPQ